MENTGTMQREGLSSGILYLVSLNHFVNDSSSMLIASLFPAMEISFGFSTYSIGLLVAVGYLILMFLQPVTGILSEKFRPMLLLPLGISTIAISMFLFILSSTFITILLSMLVLRVGTSFFHPVGTSIISKTYAGRGLDRSMGIESGAGNLGIIFAFLTSAPLYLTLGWRGPFIVYASIEVATVIFTLASLRSPAYKSLGNENSASIDLAQEREPERERAKIERKYVLGLPIFFIFIGFVIGGSNSVFGNYGNLILYHNGFNLGVSNDLVAAFYGLGFFGALLTGWFTSRLGRMKLLIISLTVTGIATLLFSYVNNANYIFTIALLVAGFMISVIYPTTYSELSEFSSARTRGGKGAGYGILFSAQIAGSAIMGYVGGYLSRTLDLNYSFTIASILLLAGALAVLFWSRNIPNKARSFSAL